MGDECEKKRENKQVIFKAYIDERGPRESNMQIVHGEAPVSLPSSSSEAALLVKNLYLSCDPYMRGRMRDFHKSYIPPFAIGSVMEGFGVSRVLESNDPRFKKGDLITGMTGWEEYSVIKRFEQLRKIVLDGDDVEIPLSYHLGLLGMPGLTAYAGFYEVCAPKPGDAVFVSAASGAVGQLVGQFAKLHGCYVVGSAGTEEKIRILKDKLGFDEAFNYKEESDLDAALKRYFPQGIDIYFENVGGAMLDAVLLNMRVFGRIAVCGMVSQQGVSDPVGIHHLYSIIAKRVKIHGFLQSDYLHLFPKFQSFVKENYKQGKILYIEDMCNGLDNAPAALIGLIAGRNVGKQVVCVSQE